MKIIKYILMGLGIIFAFLLLRGVWLGFSSTVAPKEMFEKGKEKAAGYDVSTFEAINAEREKIGVPILSVDEKLCAYARKKATELAISLEEEPQIDLAEEVNNPNNQIYFSEFENVGINYQGGGVLKRPDSNLAQMFVYQGSQAASNPQFTYGCVADSQGSNAGRVFTVFVAGGKNQ